MNVTNFIPKDVVDKLHKEVTNTIMQHAGLPPGHEDLQNVIAEVQRSIAKLGGNIPAETAIQQAKQTEQRIAESNAAAESGE